MSTPEPGIYILTGPVQSGKTTALINWSANRKDVYGILTPLAGEKRIFLDAQNREQFPMEAEAGEAEVLSVGRFRFSKNNFEKAIQTVLDAARSEGWLVIDEIGPLELRGEGFHDVLKEVLVQRKNKLLLVVREGLVEKVKEHFVFIADVILAGNLGAFK